MAKKRVLALLVTLLFLIPTLSIAFDDSDDGLTIKEYKEKHSPKLNLFQKFISLFSTKQAIIDTDWKCCLGESCNPCPSNTVPNYNGWTNVCELGFASDQGTACYYHPFTCQYTFAICEPAQPACVDECSTVGTSCNGFSKIDCVERSDGCNDELNKGKRTGSCGVECRDNSDCSSTQECNINFKCVNIPDPDPFCGDGTCNGGETKQTCSTDCGVFDPCEGINPNDNNPCTDDSCVGGNVINSPIQCPGNQVCDSATGECKDKPPGCTTTCPSTCEELDVETCSCVTIPDSVDCDDETPWGMIITVGIVIVAIGGLFWFISKKRKKKRKKRK